MSSPASSPEEGLMHTRPSSNDGEPASHDSDIPSPHSSTRTAKGKGKQSDEDAYDEDEDDQDTIHTSYPPITDEAAETRRVEENLRRWEMAERERRRAARESVQPGGPSLLGAVTRKASVLLSSRQTGKISTGGLGNHRALGSRDSTDALPLNSIDQSPRVSENPFIHPSERDAAFVAPPLSPFDDSAEQTGAMTTSDLPFPRASDSRTRSSQPASRTRTSTVIPPPRPLELPLPLTPPPGARIAPMKATPPPTLRPERVEPEREEVRWWHEWLCGCSEGPDRGGEHQAGRTNPFE